LANRPHGAQSVEGVDASYDDRHLRVPANHIPLERSTDGRRHCQHDDHLRVPVDHINLEAIDHLAGVITGHPASGCIEKVDPTHGWSQLAVIEFAYEDDLGPGVDG
jgi:hypothetical protein